MAGVRPMEQQAHGTMALRRQLQAPGRGEGNHVIDFTDHGGEAAATTPDPQGFFQNPQPIDRSPGAHHDQTRRIEPQGR